MAFEYNTPYPDSDYEETDVEKLKAIWEPRKEYIEKDLWVIRHFISPKEMEYLQTLMDDDSNWYTTMRSLYGGNIKNKFIGYDEPEYDENGVMILPGPGSKIFHNIWTTGGVQQRFEAVVVPQWAGAGAFQSFYSVPDDQIIEELGHDMDAAMEYHYERDDEEGQHGYPEGADPGTDISAAVSLYVNDDFTGGHLEFKNKDYTVAPEAGMLVNVPLYKEFEHRVGKVTSGVRHTIYGRSWDDAAKMHYSTNADC